MKTVIFKTIAFEELLAILTHYCPNIQYGDNRVHSYEQNLVYDGHNIIFNIIEVKMCNDNYY